MDHREHGENIDVIERVIVSPGVGTYQPLDGQLPVNIDVGELIGHLTVAGSDQVPVHSPFRGQLIEVVAWPGERMAHRQRIAWVRIAA
jgi:hypothetical protein